MILKKDAMWSEFELILNEICAKFHLHFVYRILRVDLVEILSNVNKNYFLQFLYNLYIYNSSGQSFNFNRELLLYI